MAVPKKKTSPSRRGMRRAHKQVTFANLSSCSHCGEPKHSHHVCLSCGHYKGRHVMMTRSQKRQEKSMLAESAES